MEEINQRLAVVQAELKAPKGQKNNFGNYNYRSCEDILEAVKPLLKAQELVLIIEDEIVLIGDRYYVKATAALYYKDQWYKTSAVAREEESKKGMDASQITGSASSYARKYALNGLFAIDDTKDADSQDNTKSALAAPKKAKAVEFAKPWEIQNLRIAAKKVTNDLTEAELTTWLEKVLNTKLDKMPRAWVAPALEKLDAMPTEAG